MHRIIECIEKLIYAVNRFYIPELCSLGITVLGITFQLRWIIAGTISKEVELRDIHLLSRFITLVPS